MENDGVLFPPEQFDQRRTLMYERLKQFSIFQLMRIYANKERICTDEFNFDRRTGFFCPIAYALDAHTWVNPVSDEAVRNYIAGYFKDVNILKGVPGTFYHGSHDERLNDLIGLIKEIVEEKKKESLDGILDYEKENRQAGSISI